MADAGYLELEEGNIPSTPAADFHRIFVDTADDKVKHKLPDGSVETLSPSSSLGTVTSVALALPVSVFSISGSPVTTTGTLSGAFINQSANTFFAGPTTGSAATPAFRLLVAGDLPVTGVTAGSYGGAFAIPSFSVDAQGRITTATTHATLTAASLSAQPADATLTALAAYNTDGFLVQTAPDTFAGRTLTAGTGISITDGNGVGGNPTITSLITQYTDELAQDAIGGALLATATVLPTYNDGANQFTWDVLPGGVNHNALLNYVANQHVDHSTVSITGASLGGLGGGGTITTNRTLNLDYTNLTAMSLPTDRISYDDLLAIYDASATAHKKITLRDFLAQRRILIDQSYTVADDFNQTATGSLVGAGGGTGNSTQRGTYGMDTVERALGISQSDTGSTSSGRRTLSSDVNSLTTGLARLRMGARIAIEQLSSGTDTFTATIGFINVAAASGDHTAGAYFRYTHSVNSGRWEAVTAGGGGSPSRTAADTGVLADTIYSIFEVEIAEDTSSAKFYINGTLVATITTNLPPTSATGNTTFGYGWKIDKSVGTTPVNISADWYYYEQVRSTPR